MKLEGLHEESEDDKNSAKRNLKESSNDEYVVWGPLIRYEEQLKRSNKGRKRYLCLLNQCGFLSIYNLFCSTLHFIENSKLYQQKD